MRAKNARTRAVASGSSCFAGSSARSSFTRLRLVVMTVADFRSSLADGGEVTAQSRSATRGVLLCAANATTSAAAVPQVGRRLFFGGGDLRLPTLWRQTMRLAQIIIFLVGALAAVGLLMESMASYGTDTL
jgi:hypothetical protein